MKIILTYTGDDWWDVIVSSDSTTKVYSFVWPMVYHWLCEQIRPIPFDKFLEFICQLPRR